MSYQHHLQPYGPSIMDFSSWLGVCQPLQSQELELEGGNQPHELGQGCKQDLESWQNVVAEVSREADVSEDMGFFLEDTDLNPGETIAVAKRRGRPKKHCLIEQKLAELIPMDPWLIETK